MSQVGVRELKDRLSGYLKRVQDGEEIVVTEGDGLWRE
jgi:prevent-host-death family protein